MIRESFYSMLANDFSFDLGIIQNTFDNETFLISNGDHDYFLHNFNIAIVVFCVFFYV